MHTPIVGFCNCSMFCCALLYVHSSLAIISMRKRELVALLSLSSCCLVIVLLLFLMMLQVCLQFAIVVFPDHTHYLFLYGSHPQCYILRPLPFGLQGRVFFGFYLIWAWRPSSSCEQEHFSNFPFHTLRSLHLMFELN